MDYQKLLELTEKVLIFRGGPTSGNWAHGGRPGKKGGSGRGGGFGRIGVKDGKAGRGKIKQASRQTRVKDKEGKGGASVGGAAEHSVSKTLGDAKKQSVSQDNVIDEIMKSNPPQQVADGRMTKDQWRDTYMSDEPGGFALINVHPSAMNIPTAAGVDEKIKDFTGRDAKAQPPIVVDSNDKIEARHGGGKLDRAFGKQPHTIIDGKHRLAASQARSDKK